MLGSEGCKCLGPLRIYIFIGCKDKLIKYFLFYWLFHVIGFSLYVLLGSTFYALKSNLVVTILGFTVPN